MHSYMARRTSVYIFVAEIDGAALLTWVCAHAACSILYNGSCCSEMSLIVPLVSGSKKLWQQTLSSAHELRSHYRDDVLLQSSW